MRGTKLEWGYLPQTGSFTNKISMVLIATAVGVSAGGLVALSFVERFVDKKGQASQVASTPSLRLSARAVDSESGKVAEGSGHAENRSSMALAEQRTAADHGLTKSLPIVAETAARSVALLEASATQRSTSRPVRPAVKSGLHRASTTCAAEPPIRTMRTVTGSGLIRMPVGVMTTGTDLSETRVGPPVPMQCGSRPIPISAGPFDDDDGRHKVMSTGYAVRLAGASSHRAGADFGLRTFERRRLFGPWYQR
jgi:hypothetical protein